MTLDKSEFIQKRIVAAKNTLTEVDTLIENNFWNTSVNRLYYACFYAVSALLHKYDMDSKTHSGTIRLFSLHFIKPGLILQLIRPAHELVATIESYLQKTR